MEQDGAKFKACSRIGQQNS